MPTCATLSVPLGCSAARMCSLRPSATAARSVGTIAVARARVGGASHARGLSQPGRMAPVVRPGAAPFGGAVPAIQGGEGAQRGEGIRTQAFEGLIEQINADPVQFVAGQLFALSLFPYLAFLYYLTKSKKVPGLALFGFYFLLFFVFATIPASIYAQQEYGTVLANVDWLHGTAESMLTVTNLFVVVGFRQGIRAGLFGGGGKGGGPAGAED